MLLSLGLLAGASGVEPDPWVATCDSSRGLDFDVARAERPDVFGFTEPPVRPRLPGEFEAKQALHLVSSYRREVLPFVGRLVAEALPHGRVVVHLAVDGTRRDLMRTLARHGVAIEQVEVRRTQLSSIWIRDFAGSWVFTGEDAPGPALVDPMYYPDCVVEDAWPTERAAALGVPVYRPPLALEGGNLLSDGHGTCFTSTVLSPANQRSSLAVQADLDTWFGCTRTVMLEPLLRDATKHVDQLLAVASPRVLLLASVPAGEDPRNAKLLDAHARTLSALAAADGSPYQVVRVPVPGVGTDGIVRSYLNLLPFNGVVFVPVFEEDRRFEALALARIAEAFPDRRVVPIAADALVGGGGAVHCATWVVP